MAGKGLNQRDLTLLGIGAVIIVGGAFLIFQGPGAMVDPGTIEVSDLNDDSLYEGTVDENDVGLGRRGTKDRTKRTPEKLEPIPPLPQHPLIKVYFNQSRSQVYTDPYREIPRYGDDLEQIIADTISKANISVDLAVHELNLPRIAKAVAAKQQQGLQVRLILENTYTRDLGIASETELGEMDERLRDRAEEVRSYIDINEDGKITPDELKERDALYILNQAGVPLIDDTADGSKGSGLMHNKYVLVDKKVLVTGSTNFTFSDVHGDRDAPDTRGNTNNLLVINSPELVQVYQQDFNQMWGDGPKGLPNSKFGAQKTFIPLQSIKIGDVMVGVQFSPAGAKVPDAAKTNGTISQILGGATKSVHMALFVFSGQDIADALLSAKQNTPDLEIKGMFDPNFSYRDFSETLDMWGLTLASRLCTIEEVNNPWSAALTTIGVPVLPKGDKMHHKFGVVDGLTVITGSHNWSKAANSNNDENTLIFTSPVIAAHYEREFDRMYKRSFLGPSKKLLEKIQTTSSRCPNVVQKVAKEKKVKPPKVMVSTPSTPTSSNPTSSVGVVNINTADASTLDQLPGIGPTAAKAIVSYREVNGPFRSLDELDNVKGIGAATLEKIQGQVKF